MIEKLGVCGCILLLQLVRYIPENFCIYRRECIAYILNTALKLKLTPCSVNQLIAKCEAVELDDVIGNPSMSLLWEATFQNGSPHTVFLAPPVTACITCPPKLSTHNKPTTVICYTCTGPMPAMKITLRCDKCGTNYR